MTIKKTRRKARYDKNLHKKELRDGDLALLFSSKKHNGKLNPIGDSPYVVHYINENGVVMLKTLEGDLFPHHINESFSKLFYVPNP